MFNRKKEKKQEKKSKPWDIAKEKRLKHRSERRGKLLALTFMLTEVMVAGSSPQDQEMQMCTIFTIKMWPMNARIPLSTSSLLDLMRMARAWRQKLPGPETKPAIVLSHNGVSRCGVYIAANIIIDQMEMDEEMDIFHAVKMCRINRPELIDCKDEYKYIYDLILHYCMSTPKYAIITKQRIEREEAEKRSLEKRTRAMKYANMYSNLAATYVQNRTDNEEVVEEEDIIE